MKIEKISYELKIGFSGIEGRDVDSCIWIFHDKARDEALRVFGMNWFIGLMNLIFYSEELGTIIDFFGWNIKFIGSIDF